MASGTPSDYRTSGSQTARAPGTRLPSLGAAKRLPDGEAREPAWITPRRGKRGGELKPLNRKEDLKTSAGRADEAQNPGSTRTSSNMQPDKLRRSSISADNGRRGSVSAEKGGRRLSVHAGDKSIVGNVASQIIDEDGEIEDAFKDVGPSFVEKRKVVILESEPVLVLEKKSIPKLGKMKKTSMPNLRNAEAKIAAEAIMQSREPGAKPRYSKQEAARQKARKQRPVIEVLEVEGATLLGVPGSSSVQQFSTYKHKGRVKQIVIAMHENKPPRLMGGAVGATESDSAVMRSGVAELSKQLAALRETLAGTRTSHNAFNELSKYATVI